MSDIASVPGEPTRTVSMTSSVNQGDLPMDGHGRNQIMVIETPQSNNRRKWMWSAVILLVICMMATIIGLSIGLTRSNNNNGATASDDINANIGSGNTDKDIAASNKKLESVRNHIRTNNYSSAASLDDPNTPQSKAATFLANGIWAVPANAGEETSTFLTYKWLELYVLTVFYYSTNGDNWKSKSNFLHEKFQACGWNALIVVGYSPILEGALCTSTASTALVDILGFVDNDLNGPLPSELGLLTALKQIFVLNNPIEGSDALTANDEVTGTIPESFANLKNLMRFECIFCSLAGTFPTWIGQLPFLQSFFLKGSRMTGSFPAGMSSLANLVELSLEDNLMTGDLSELENLSNLKFLYLEDNDFAQTIDETFLSKLSNLEILDISDNRFDGQVPVHLLSSAATSLTTMDVHGNALTSFPDTIPADSSMDFLAVHENPIVGPFPVATIANLAPTLDHLDVTSTQFSGTMPTEIANLTKLNYLFLADVTSLDAGTIPEEYQQLTNLVDWSLKHSQRTGTIPAWIGNSLEELVLLDLDSNELTGTIPPELGNLVNLVSLLLNRNQLTGTVPSALRNITQLRMFHLDHNTGITGSLEPLCSTINPATLFATSADCLGSPAFPAPVNCSCCTTCCAPGDLKCNENDGLAAIDPEWSNSYERRNYFFQDGNFTEDRRLAGEAVVVVDKKRRLGQKTEAVSSNERKASLLRENIWKVEN